MASLPGSGAARALVSRAAGLVPRYRPGNLDARDPDTMRELLPALWLAISAWYRPELHGLEHIPERGAGLIVGNHSGGLISPEVFVSQLGIAAYLGVERPFYQLAHRMVLNSPAAPVLRPFGTVEADPDNARQVLDEGGLLQVFPGGDYEVYRPSWQSARIDFGRRKGFLRLALEHDVPVVPQVTLGGQETALFLSRGERLARLLGVDRSLRLKVLPVVVGLPTGLLPPFAPFIPLPSKIVIRYLEPIDLRAQYGDHPDLDRVYDDIVARMQAALTDLQARRRFPVLG